MSENKKQLSFHPDDESDESDGPEDSSLKKHEPKISNVNSIKASGTHVNQTEDQYEPDSSYEAETSKKSKNESVVEEDAGDNVSTRDKKIQEIRAQIQAIKEQLEQKSKFETLSEKRSRTQTNSNDSKSTQSSDKVTLKGAKRERETLDMVTDFRKKMKEASKKTRNGHHSSSRKVRDERSRNRVDNDDIDLELIDDDLWITHRFEVREEDDQR